MCSKQNLVFQKNVWFIKLQPELHKRKGAIGYSQVIEERCGIPMLPKVSSTIEQPRALSVFIHPRRVKSAEISRMLAALAVKSTCISAFCSTPQMAKWLGGQQHFILLNKLHNDSDYIYIILYIIIYIYYYIYIYCSCSDYYLSLLLFLLSLVLLLYVFYIYIYIHFVYIYIYMRMHTDNLGSSLRIWGWSIWHPRWSTGRVEYVEYQSPRGLKSTPRPGGSPMVENQRKIVI